MKEHLEHFVKNRKKTTLFINKGEDKVYLKDIDKNDVLFVKSIGDEATPENKS